MEQNNIDIAAILKGMPKGTKLYSSLCGKATLFCLGGGDDYDAITIHSKSDTEVYLYKEGKYDKDGEVVLFPSKEMRDWGHFYKKGDIVEHVGDHGEVATCIFEEWEDMEYTRFKAKFYYYGSNKWMYEVRDLVTLDWYKSNAPESYIEVLEKNFGGKLNRETLEVEMLKPTFELGKLYVFNEEDEDGELTIIGELIAKNESQDTLTFGNQYEIETERFETHEAFDLRISAHKELREATNEERDTFGKAHQDWRCEQEDKRRKKAERKQPKDAEGFKPFDKVLVRNKDNAAWLPAFYAGKDGGKHKVLFVSMGFVGRTSNCIKYEGNEHLAFTSDPF